MRRIYAARRAALIDALSPGDGNRFTIDASPAGLMLLLRLAAHENDEALVIKLASLGISVQSLSSHYGGKAREQGLLLSFAGFTEKELRAAAKVLLSTLPHKGRGMALRP